jgi:GAF domain-containing protein
MSSGDQKVEAARLEKLRLYKIVDTAAEKVFDDLTRLASVICDVPICLVSFVTQDRQWFKARVGLDASETSRSHAFCAHAILEDEIMIVEDASQDPRFADNPLVTGEPHIRFYAGAPLEIEEGVRLGTLCVIDQRPRTLSDHQIEALSVLREATVSQLHLRRSRDELRSISELLPICAWCQHVRTEQPGGKSAWLPLHDYLMQTTPVTHGICPDCRSKNEI